ncbi:hypothetical protein Cni_G28543 [Canna indica]|uniref:Protein KAKU4 n=1 Tax=Canna indica TaxID=4628 RepID=A0AAQ3QSF4_9LILI|nr:hypothetical protein Cni_G28543 [Canna indica]
MASLFRARRPAAEGGGSGGKILRGRRAPPPSSPYARPVLSPTPTGSPRWFLGLVSGAGKLISSVFRSDGKCSPSSSSSSGCSSDEGSGCRSEEQENFDAHRELHGFDQELKQKELITAHVEGSHAIVSTSGNKLAIEKLLRKETFSRDECNKLTKLIQSRVVESPSEFVQDGEGREVMNKGAGTIVDSLRDWRSLEKNQELCESVQYSTSNLWSLSPRTPTFRACTHDVYSTAVMEARRWLEEKKLSSKSRVDPVCGSCTLNDDMLHHATDDKVISPVDLAKSYMGSLPPWQSPRFGSSGLKTSVSYSKDFDIDESRHVTTSCSLPPFKDFKKKYLSSRSRESPVHSRSVRQKLVEEMLESSRFKQIGSLEKLFENETSNLPAVDEKSQDVLGTKHYSYSLQALQVPSAPAKSCELLVGDQCSKDTLNSTDEKTAKTSPVTIAEKSTSIILTSEPKEAVKVVEPTEETALLTISSSDLTVSEMESEPKLPLASNKYVDVMKPSPIEQEDNVGSNSPCECVISDSIPLEHTEPKEAIKVAKSTEETALPSISSSDPIEANIESKPKSPIASNEHMDTIEPSPMEQEDNVATDTPCGYIISDFIPAEHAVPKEAVKVVVSTEEIALPNINSSDPTKSIAESASDEYVATKDVIEPSLIEQEDNVDSDDPCKFVISASITLEHAGDYMSEKVVVSPKENKHSTLSDTDDVANIANNGQASNANIHAGDVTNLVNDFQIHTTPVVVGIPEVNSSMELNLDPDAKREEGIAYSQDEANGSAYELSSNDEIYVHSSNSVQTAAISTGSCGLPSENTINTQAAHGTDSSASKFENGTTMKSIEQVLNELQPSDGSPRKRTVAKRRRGRGQGRGRGGKRQ